MKAGLSSIFYITIVTLDGVWAQTEIWAYLLYVAIHME